MPEPSAAVLFAAPPDKPREWLRLRLEELGCEVSQASDGASALQRMHERPPDILVACADLPILDGYLMVQALRRAPKFERLLAILLTETSSESDIARGWMHGADLCVPLDQPREDILGTILRVFSTTYCLEPSPAWLKAALPSR